MLCRYVRLPVVCGALSIQSRYFLTVVCVQFCPLRRDTRLHSLYIRRKLTLRNMALNINTVTYELRNSNSENTGRNMLKRFLKTLRIARI